MNSLREIIESSPSVRHLAFTTERENDEPQPLGPARWDWSSISLHTGGVLALGGSSYALLYFSLTVSRNVAR